MSCGECENSRGSGENMIYCRLFGIFVRKDYEGCRYHEQIWQQEGEDAGGRF